MEGSKWEKRVDEIVEDVVCYDYWFKDFIKDCVRNEVETWSDDQLRDFRAEPEGGMQGITSISINKGGELQELPVMARQITKWEGNIPPGTLIMTPRK